MRNTDIYLKDPPIKNNHHEKNMRKEGYNLHQKKQEHPFLYLFCPQSAPTITLICLKGLFGQKWKGIYGECDWGIGNYGIAK